MYYDDLFNEPDSQKRIELLKRLYDEVQPIKAEIICNDENIQKHTAFINMLTYLNSNNQILKRNIYRNPEFVLVKSNNYSSVDYLCKQIHVTVNSSPKISFNINKSILNKPLSFEDSKIFAQVIFNNNTYEMELLSKIQDKFLSNIIFTI